MSRNVLNVPFNGGVVQTHTPIGLRFAQYPDGIRRLQGAYPVMDEAGVLVDWIDIPLVFVDAKGLEYV